MKAQDDGKRRSVLGATITKHRQQQKKGKRSFGPGPYAKDMSGYGTGESLESLASNTVQARQAQSENFGTNIKPMAAKKLAPRETGRTARGTMYPQKKRRPRA